jgi:hypothetical protein
MLRLRASRPVFFFKVVEGVRVDALFRRHLRTFHDRRMSILILLFKQKLRFMWGRRPKRGLSSGSVSRPWLTRRRGPSLARVG